MAKSANKKNGATGKQKDDCIQLEKIVITTRINDRKQYVASLTTSEAGAAYIPRYTTMKERAKDFLSARLAQEYIDAIKPAGMRTFNIETLKQKLQSK